MPANPGDRYRLSAQAPLRRAEGLNVGATDSTPAPPRWRVWETVLIVVFVLLFAAVVVIGGGSLVTRGQLALVALVPLVLVTALLTWIDRWAPPGWRYRWFALLWGAGVAASGAILVNSSLYQDLLLYRGSPEWAGTFAAVIIAPISEELFKGLGVVTVLVLARRQLTSTLSAVALAGLVGAGFAYVENLDYFWQAYQEGSTVFGFTVFARSVMSPFIHPMATSLTGLAVGSALLAGKGWFWRLPLGFVGAVAVHALWNGMAMLGAIWVLVYLVVELPLFIAWLTWLLVWSQRMARQIHLGLVPYVLTGWISPAEVALTVTPSGRRAARRWARKLKGRRPLRRLQRAVGRLGMDQQVMSRRGPNLDKIEQDRQHLAEVARLRAELKQLELAQ